MISAEKARELLDGAQDTPWRVGAEGSEGSRINPDTGDKRTDSRYIASVNGRVQPEDGRNARLIAAAPDLAAAVIAQAEQLTDLREQIALARGHVNDLQAFGLLSPSNVDTLLAILVEDQP